MGSVKMCVSLATILCCTVLLLNGSLVSCYVDDDDDDIYIVPPRPEDNPYPLMLHERDVIHYVNMNKDFLEVGSGAFANITLGELRGSGFPVIVKKFRSSSFYDILHEVRVHRYVYPLGFTPMLIGVLPTGPMSRNVSLVYEYIDHSKDLFHLVFDDEETFSNVQWLQICHEMAVNLHKLHQNGVLYNDLHRKNILIQRQDERIKTYIIDYGMATYRTGKLYKHDESSLEGYAYLAPELVNYTYTSEAADIYALGYILLKITSHFPEPNLEHLAHWCSSNDPKDRPDLPEVISRIEKIYLELTSYCGGTCQDLIRFQYLNKDDNKTQNGSIEDSQDAMSSLRDRITAHKTVSPMLGIINGYINCHTSIPVMNSKDFVHGVREWITNHEDGKDNAIRISVLDQHNETVIVKDFYGVDYELVREEACITMYLADRGVAPKVIGITIEYKMLSDIGFVQEYFGQGVTLSKFVKLTDGFEWDLNNLRKVAEHDYRDLDPVASRPDICRVNFKTLLLSLISDLARPMCKSKSYRQRILEHVAVILVSHLKVAHDSGMLINNLRLQNVIVKWNQTKRGSLEDMLSTAIDIRLIDLNVVTSFKQSLQYNPKPLYENKYSYLAPEVVLGHKTTKESDIYSACVAVRSILMGYFSINDEAVQFQRFRMRRHQSQQDVRAHCSPDNGGCTVGNGGREWTLGKKYIKHNYDSSYSMLQRLLLKCLHASHALRPNIGEIIQLLREISTSNYDGVWL